MILFIGFEIRSVNWEFTHQDQRGKKTANLVCMTIIMFEKSFLQELHLPLNRSLFLKDPKKLIQVKITTMQNT